jgi:hypothetical protein
MMVLGLPVLLIALGGAGPDVRGVGGCPSTDEVAAHLRPLLPHGELPPDTWLELSDAAPDDGPPGDARARQIEVRLRTAGADAPVGTRRLAVAGSCAEAADAVAVVAASWMARYLTPPAATPWLADTTPAASPAVAAAIRRVPQSEPGPARTGVVVDVGGGAGLTSATAGTAAPFVTAEVDLRRSGRASAARLVLLAMGARTVDLGSGTAAWQRLAGGAGAARGWGTPAAFMQLGIDALAGAARIQGRAFASNQSSTSFDAGGAPWLRAGAGLAALPITVWASAGAVVWLREQRVRVEGVPASATLPRLDLVLGVGLAFTPGAAKSDRR